MKSTQKINKNTQNKSSRQIGIKKQITENKKKTNNVFHHIYAIVHTT